MFKLRQDQYKALADATFEAYIGRLVEKLKTDPFAGSRRRWFPSEASDAALGQAVRRLIDKAENLGFECEGDVTPFVLLEFAMTEICEENGLEDWIRALLQAREAPPEERMNGVYEILPEVERRIVFD